MKDCLIIAGEKSGEEHAMSFLNELKNRVKDVRFFGVGGDLMQESGVELIYHLNDFSTWGISGAIKKIPFYYKALQKVEDEVIKRGCRVAILIDYQTYNLKLATRLKKRGVKVLYYVAPQAWVWKEYRVKVLEQCVDTLFCIIPFERKWFMDRGVSKAVSIEHPLLKHYKDDLAGFTRIRRDFAKEEINILLLPGSRNFEVLGLLSTFMGVVRELKKSYRIIVSIVESTSVNKYAYKPYRDEIDVIYKDSELVDALKVADFSLAASGTVNLACGLYEVPTVVAYTGSLFNKYIFDTFIRYEGFVSLTNIIHQKEIFPEIFIPRDTVFNIFQATKAIFEDKFKYNDIMEELKKTKELVSGDNMDISNFLANKIKDAYEC